MKGKSNLLIYLLIGGLLFYFASSGTFHFGATESAVSTGNSISCPDDGTTDLNVRAKNPLNSSLDWVGATVYYADANGLVLGSAALNSDGTFKTVSTSTSCGGTYNLYVLSNSNYVSESVKDVKLEGARTVIYDGKTAEGVDMSIPKSTDVEFEVFDSSYNNETSGWVQDATTNVAHTLGAGDSDTVILKYRAKDSAAQFGSDELPVYVCADFDLAKFSKTNGVTVSGADWTVASTLPKYCAENGYEKAWIIKPVKSSDGEQTATINIRADLGDPGASDDIKLMFVDSAYYQGSDGTVKSGTSDDSANDVGATNRYITINVE